MNTYLIKGSSATFSYVIFNTSNVFFLHLEAVLFGNEDPKFDASLLQLLLEEIRNLRVQLQKSIDTNMALKEKLEEQLGMSFNTSGR